MRVEVGRGVFIFFLKREGKEGKGSGRRRKGEEEMALCSAAETTILPPIRILFPRTLFSSPFPSYPFLFVFSVTLHASHHLRSSLNYALARVECTRALIQPLVLQRAARNAGQHGPLAPCRRSTSARDLSSKADWGRTYSTRPSERALVPSAWPAWPVDQAAT